ncbi:ATP-binding protein [Xanthobacteraceae bacterium A53D]
MSEPTHPMPPQQEALLAPLRRDDLPSFLVVLPDMEVLAATLACEALGIERGGLAPLGVKIVAKRVAMSLRRAPRIERVRLPFSLMPRSFACIALQASIGQVVLFADPLALAAGADPSRALPGLTRLPVVVRPPMASGDQRAMRFAFACDEAGRLTRLSHGLLEALDSSEDQWLGRNFSEIAQAGLLGDVAPLLAALASGDSFFGLDVPTGETPPRRLEFGGVPLFDVTRRRRGTRGFGMLWSDAPAAEPAMPAETPDTPPVSRRKQPPLNVVPLRAGALSAREQSAFHEIARTLTEAVEEWPRSSSVSSSASSSASATADRVAAETAPEETPASAQPAPAVSPAGEDHLLDRLPIGIVVQQAGATVRANRTLLGWLGIKDIEEFVAAGGLSPRLVRDGRSGQLDLESIHGDRLPVEVRLVSSPWQGRPALVHVIRPLEGGSHPMAPQPAAEAPASTSGPVPRAERLEVRRQALDLIPYPVLVLGRSGAVEIANVAAGGFGFAVEELEGEPFTLMLAADSHVSAVAMLDRALAGEGQQEARLSLRRRAGGRQPMDAVLALAGDHAARFCLIMHPVKAEAAALAPAPGQNGDPSEMDAFARRLSHDVRDPLNVLISFVESVKRNVFGPVGNRRYHQLADTAGAAGDRLIATLDDLDELTVPPGEQAASVPLAPIIEAALAHLSDSARRRRILLRSALPQEDMAAPCDEAALGQIVRLLLDEALAATPAEGQVIVSLSESEAGEALIQIRDGGEGLDEAEIRQALDPACPTPTSDRFGRAGRPFRMARLAALARAQGATLALKRGVETGMLAQLTIPR